MPGAIKIFCIRMNILSHRNNIVLFLACNIAAMQNLYCQKFPVSVIVVVSTLSTVISIMSIIPGGGGGGWRGTPSDGDDQMGAKVKPKKIPRASNKALKILCRISEP